MDRIFLARTRVAYTLERSCLCLRYRCKQASQEGEAPRSLKLVKQASILDVPLEAM